VTARPVPARGARDVGLAAVLWGTAGTAQELWLPTSSPVAVAGVRCLLGGGVLLLVALTPSRRAALVEVLRFGGRPLWASAAAMTVFQAFYLLGIRTAGVALGTLVALGSAPAWAGLLARLGGRRPSVRWFVATVVAVVGLAALVLADQGPTRLEGIAPAAIAGFAYASYTTASAHLGGLERGAVVATVFTVCGLALLPATIVTGGIPIAPEPLLGVLWLAVGTTIVAYRRFLAGLRHLDAPTATTLSLLEPLTATVLAVTLVGERLTWLGVVGVLLLLAGVVGASRSGSGRVRTGARTPSIGRSDDVGSGP
jgi:drug/metabolite transporter, DME family